MIFVMQLKEQLTFSALHVALVALGYYRIRVLLFQLLTFMIS